MSGDPGFDALAEMALDMRWSWNHSTDEVWRRLDPELWESTRNPWVVLQSASRDRVRQMSAEPEFRRLVDDLTRARLEAAGASAWFQKTHGEKPLTCVAYFCMEFMLSEALPIYSGGLGNVAGDQLKAASDLGVPVVGVGLLYQQGYFRQLIDKNGDQQALYPYNEPGQLPVTPLRRPDGEWLRLEIALPGYSIWLRTWQVQVGRTKLYLLDSNDAANFPAHRAITSQLYGGGPELRLKQELLLGIGGWRLLSALGLRPEVCHLNEGHAAFAVLERAREFMQETKQSYEVALAATRAGNLFTTHTAVAAGFDLFAPNLIKQYLTSYAEQKLGISLRDLLALGRKNPDDGAESFNMAYLAVRGCGAVNAVSRLHGRVSRRLFQPLFPRWPESEVPIGHVTNGVHVPTWDSAAADEIWTGACGKDRWLGEGKNLEAGIRGVSDAALWAFRNESRRRLVDYARARLSRQLAVSGASPAYVDAARRIFDPNALTLGFARRFAAYKRPNLLLRDPERLIRLLTIPGRPVQLILAGKAHPEDRAGQDLIRDWISFIRTPEARPHVVFLSDYDMQLTKRLVHGVDVWINTPRRPWEACGTSGMKVLVNGGLNLSELDGWWAEAYAPNAGWALGDGREHGDDPRVDAEEAEQLYEILERRVVPGFYERGADGIPAAWTARIRESLAGLTPRFSAERAVREYTQAHYLPAAAAYRARAADRGGAAGALVARRRDADRKWAALSFGPLRTSVQGDQRLFEAELDLKGLDPSEIEVELYADGVDGGAPVVLEMQASVADAPSRRVYRAAVSAGRAERDYTPRAVPRRAGAAVPLESDRILWQR